jgi:LuxR family transcriptional regulator, maltose regulon positive regulatory protein
VHLALAEAHLDGTAPERRRLVENAIASSRLALARRRGRFAEVTDRVERLGFAGVGRPPDIGLGSELRGTALMNLGIVEMWSGRMGQAERHLSQGAELARKIDRPYLELACRAHLGFASIFQSFSIARERCHEALAVAARHGWDDRPLIAPALGTLAVTSIWMGELDEGERWLQRAWTSVEENLDPANGVLLHLAAAMLHAARSEEQRSLEELELAGESQALVEDEHVLAPLVSAWLASTLARLGRPEQARTFLESIPAGRADAGEIRAARATVSFAAGDAGAALAEVQTVMDGTSTVIGAFTLVEANLIAGLAHLELGSRGEAKAAAEAALTAAEPDRLMLPFAVADSLRLLEAVPPQDTAHRALLIEVRELLGGGPTGPARNEWIGSPDPLSPSELRVLRYLPTNLTRPEIAQELYVSVNTVNTHIRNIYAKLGARGRSSAVQRARELQLLAAGRSR